MPPGSLQYLTINDFSPGIFSSFGFAGKTTTAPLGAAQVTNTYRCQPLPGGGLGPMPKRYGAAGTVGFNALPQPDVEANYIGYPYIVGLRATGPVSPTAYDQGLETFDDLLVVFEYLYNNAGTPQRRQRVYRVKTFDLGTKVLLSSQNSAIGVIPLDAYWGCSFATTRIHNTDPMLPGTPLDIWDWSEVNPNVGRIQTIAGFPDPASPNTDTVRMFSTTRTGQILAHQNRVVLLENNLYARGAGAVYLNPPFNEDVSFTDPPNSPTLGTQNYIFSQENPTGYGAWGSINAGELFLVKNGGGGVIVSGDINNPQVTRLPGVVSTNGLINQAASTAIGLVYCTRGSGAFVWAGSSSSQRISSQLDPSFFYIDGARIDANGKYIEGVEVVVTEWDEFIAFPNNWIYDIGKSSWWRLDDPAEVVVWRTAKGFTNNLWGTSRRLATGPNPASLYWWDKRVPASSYSWQSHPIPVTLERLVEIEEVVLLCQGQGTVTVTLTEAAGSTKTVSFAINSLTQPKKFKLNIGVNGYNIIARIVSTATSTGAAPMVYSLALGYNPGNLVIPT